MIADPPPPPQINIINLGQYTLPKTCFEVRDDTQALFFTVCDNDFQRAPAAEAICVPDGVCNDEDPANGLIRVTIAEGDYTVVVSKPAVNHTATMASGSKAPASRYSGSMSMKSWTVGGSLVVAESITATS